MNARDLSCDERKRRGIRRDGKPRVASQKGQARIVRAEKRSEAAERAESALPRACGHRHTRNGARHCRKQAAA